MTFYNLKDVTYITVSYRIFKKPLALYNNYVNLKDVRIAALCSLACAGFFRHNKLCNIAPNHIEFHSEYT